MQAVLIFKGVMIEWVVVKGWEEELVKADGQPDIWGESRYQVRDQRSARHLGQVQIPGEGPAVSPTSGASPATR